jgi:DNA-binding protein HU-beta
MTKNELADRVAQRIGIAAEQVRQALDASFDAVADELASGGEVALAGFGKFSVSHRSARQGRSPSTGETIQIASSSQAKFSSASALKKRLNP